MLPTVPRPLLPPGSQAGLMLLGGYGDIFLSGVEKFFKRKSFFFFFFSSPPTPAFPFFFF